MLLLRKDLKYPSKHPTMFIRWTGHIKDLQRDKIFYNTVDSKWLPDPSFYDSYIYDPKQHILYFEHGLSTYNQPPALDKISVGDYLQVSSNGHMSEYPVFDSTAFNKRFKKMPNVDRTKKNVAYIIYEVLGSYSDHTTTNKYYTKTMRDAIQIMHLLNHKIGADDPHNAQTDFGDYNYYDYSKVIFKTPAKVIKALNKHNK